MPDAKMLMWVTTDKETSSARKSFVFRSYFDSIRREANLTFVGETAPFAERIQEELPQSRIVPTLPSAYECGLLGQRLAPENVDAFVPQYLKRVEAEENWLKDHQVSDDSQYIKRV